MLRLTLRQARSTAGRLLLAGVAVALGAGFVAAVLLTSALFTRTITSAVAAQYAGADVVVRTNGAPLTDAQLAALDGAPGIAAAEGRVDDGVALVGPSGTEYVTLRSTSTTPALADPAASRLSAGELPRASGQLALGAAAASRLGVGVGGTVSVRYYPLTGSSAAQETAQQADPETGAVDAPVTVVGLLRDDEASRFTSSADALAAPADAVTWTASRFGDLPDGTPRGGYSTALVVDAPGTSPEQARDVVAQRLAAEGLAVQTGDWDPSQGWTGQSPPLDVLTVPQVVDRSVDDALGGTRILTAVVLAFAAVALFVATTVITNTFSVVVAQRTHQLALLRCVGATTAQVHRSVLAEAAVLGLVASAVGVLAGTGLAAVAGVVLTHFAPGVSLPAGVVLTPAAVLVPLAVGTGATVLAALAPARAATRVSPLAALRPAAAPDLRTRTSRVRLAVSLVLLVGGTALLAGGALFATGALDGVLGEVAAGGTWTTYGLAAAVLGGTASFTGVLVGQVFLVPRTVALVGRLVSRAGGAPARLAALNAVRNPRRTASTAGALLIGTTLVALMVVGAATTSRTLDAALDRQYPVDVEVGTVPTGPGRYGGALPAAVVQGLAAVDGITASTSVLTSQVSLVPGDTRRSGGDSASGSVLDAVAAPAASLQRVLADPAAVAGLQPGAVVLPLDVAERLGVHDGDEVTLRPTTTTTTTTDDGGSSGFTSADLNAPGVLLTARVTQLGGQAVALDPSVLRQVDPAAAASALWLRLAPGTDPVEVSGRVQSVVTSADSATGSDGAAAGQEPVSVTSQASERAAYQHLIDTMLLVVVGLLAVAVVIALVGVANTLSLSVIERTRENAVLRALGLTRGQLRRMLALEGALVAGVGGLLGVVLGSLYGWAGAASLLGGVATAGGDAIWTPALPWARLALLLAVAVLAGLAASVLPARRAVRTPPVAALADR